MFAPKAPVLEAIRRLNAAGFACHLVGGCVRDFLLGIPPTDYDLTTNALPPQIKTVFADCHQVDTGIAHGTVTVHVDGLPLEITTYRIDGAYSDDRHPDAVRFTNALSEDLARRDFTMNAIAWHPQLGLTDPFDGADAIGRHKIVCVGDPTTRFREDALRILRAVRFASTLGFSMEAHTETAVHALCERLQAVSPERIHVELDKLLCGQNVTQVLLRFPDILCVFIPEIRPAIGFLQHSRFHRYDVWSHTAHTVGIANASRLIRLTMLLHDLGKPDCFTQDPDGTGHFKGHAPLGAARAADILHRLRYDKRTIDAVTTLIRYHSDRIRSEVQMRRLLSRLGEERFFELLQVQRADTRSKQPFCLGELPDIDRYEALAKALIAANACLHLCDLAVNGRDLQALGFEGTEIGRTLQALLDAVLSGTLPNEAAALKSAALDNKKNA